jgi:homoserine O-acetyltransferase
MVTSGKIPASEITGPPGAPVVAVLGGISATRHVTATAWDRTPGWWEPLVGPGRAIDTDETRALGVDFLDGGRASDGRPARIITTHDQADGVRHVLDNLGVDRLSAFVGASYGGMVALAFAERYPTRVDRVVAISAPHAPHPLTTALRALQRRIVALGLDTGQASEALALARGLAMTTYRSTQEFGERFSATPDEVSVNDAIFPVESYLRHHGERFAATWTPARFLALSLSADLHSVQPSAICVPTTVVCAEGDRTVPREQLEWLASRLAAPSELMELSSTHGHDAFLTETKQLGRILRSVLSSHTLTHT